jgi:hypothetical protein
MNGIKSEGMRASREGKAKVEKNDYLQYTMEDVPGIPDYKIKFPKGEFNGLRAYYNIRTDPELGLGYAAIRRVACGCASCKDQLRRAWVAGVEKREQPRYVRNEECNLWPSYEGRMTGKYVSSSPRMRTKRRERGNQSRVYWMR